METRVHGKFLRELMVAIHKTYPELEVERLLMDLDSAVQISTAPCRKSLELFPDRSPNRGRQRADWF